MMFCSVVSEDGAGVLWVGKALLAFAALVCLRVVLLTPVTEEVESF